MPSFATPRRTSNRLDSKSTQTKSKPVDVGTPLGPYDTNSVRDRVRQWQSQGGGVVTASDIGVEDDEEKEQDAGRKTKTSEKDLHVDVITVEYETETQITPRKRSSRRKSRVAHVERETRSISAPRKRVVSDQHWRKHRSPPRSTTHSRTRKDSTPTQKLPDDGIRVKAIPDNEASKSRSHGREKSPPTAISPRFDDGIRVYATPPGSRRQSAHLQVPVEGELGNRSESDVEKPIPKTTPSPPRKHDTGRRKSEHNVERSPRLESSAKDKENSKKKSNQRKERTPEKSPRMTQGEFEDSRDSTKSQKSNILSHVFDESRKIFARTDVLPIVTPRIPSVEAWLSETPDPFIDADELPVEMPPPLKTNSRRKQESKETVPEDLVDPNGIWDTLEKRHRVKDGGTGSKRRRRVPSSTLYEGNPFPDDLNTGPPLDSSSHGSVSATKLVDIAPEGPKLSPSSLRRRGAKKDSLSPSRERRKSSPLKESLNIEENATAISSASTISSVEPLNISSRPLRPPGLNIRRQFPSTGLHRLSTIASVETFSTRIQDTSLPSLSYGSETTQQPTLSRENDLESEARDEFDPGALQRRSSKSRVTKHADLISVLSLPRAGSKSIQSARSIRTNRSRLATATIGDIMEELATDETKYMRELRTLVDGVIPVLLTCVLSKSDSAVAAGLFSPLASNKNDPQFTRPIVDMGIALERLKTLHKRAPRDDPSLFLTWAQGAQKVYSEYLKAWRMGFQDVVVNLAPAADDKEPGVDSPSGKSDGLDEGLPRNEDGDVVDSNGERVDVAFLLKRPLVRLKYLAKTLKGINFVNPSAEAASLAAKYQDLVTAARHRSNEERARLEDEAASNIDPTRVRDLSTLAPLSGVSIDSTRRVRARDCFNLDLKHSSGQRIDCRVEFLVRDDPPDRGNSGDLLVCEVDGTGRWLLLPPVQFGRVSARNGDLKGEIIVMIRGLNGNGEEWHELLSLRTEDEQTGFEWVQMLGLNPVPPKVMRTQSFLRKQERRKTLTAPVTVEKALPDVPVRPMKSRTPSPRDIEVPIGERAGGTSKIWAESVVGEGLSPAPLSPSPRERNRLHKVPRDSVSTTSPRPASNLLLTATDIQSLPSQKTHTRTNSSDAIRSPMTLNEILGFSGTSTGGGLKRTKAKRQSRHIDDVSSSPISPVSSPCLDEGLKGIPCSEIFRSQVSSDSLLGRKAISPSISMKQEILPQKDMPVADEVAVRPRYHRKKSSVPSLELPTIPKIRKESPPTTPVDEPEEEPVWPIPDETEPPPPTPPKLTRSRPATPTKNETPPPPPAHGSPSLVQIKGTQTPDLSSSVSRSVRRRSSSPLKHEYAPSTASESSSDSDASTVEHNETMSMSESSEDEELEDGDTPTPLLPLGALHRLPKLSPQGSLYSVPKSTLSPSQSASQAPYKKVPSQPTKASKTIASIFSWSDKGCWENMHPDECSILITPGLIEAFEMSASHSHVGALLSPPISESDSKSELSLKSSSQAEETASDRPLVALELTPLVPIRRGTALDISIRSPPTANSKITSRNNIMFRSRNPEECEALYALINYSRINNPTYIALQNARATSSFAPSFDRAHSVRGAGRSSSWFGFGGARSSYRASSAPTPSIAPSESSIGSMTSAFSALRRFGKAGNMFNISRSTITSRAGSGANSVYTSSDNSSGSGTSSPLPPGVISPINPNEESKTSPLGLSNAKIRLYIRETASKWRDLGSARLTIMRPTNSSHPLLGGSRPQQQLDEKRILIRGKAADTLLLDVTLGESCFERVARTGIAVSVWEAFEGGAVQKEGGVVGGSLRVFMIQVRFSL
ncbi:hypothetical protein MMC14_000487 [Varicellaria rhodocarpa]|nr:hypothetical protein [Varicellaria rhodocarpa]